MYIRQTAWMASGVRLGYTCQELDHGSKAHLLGTAFVYRLASQIVLAT